MPLSCSMTADNCVLQMPGVEFDEHGNPRLPNMGEQCMIM